MVSLFMKKRKNIQSMCQKKKTLKKNVKRHYVLIKDFNTFIFDHTLHRGKKKFVVIVYKLLLQQEY